MGKELEVVKESNMAAPEALSIASAQEHVEILTAIRTCARTQTPHGVNRPI